MFVLLCCLLLAETIVTGYADAAPTHMIVHRDRRDINIRLDASYEEQIGGALLAELDGRLWRNEAGTAHVDGTASYSQPIDSIGGGTAGLGNAKVAASVRFHLDQ